MSLNMHMKNDQRGGASIFVVIFAALLMLVVTMSFVQLMMSDQKQASTMDLSQSAHDSAQAGVEDAKRALLLYQSCQGDGSSQCVNTRAAFASPECNMVRRALNSSGASDTAETVVRKNGSAGNDDALLQQAYTCVKVQLNSDDYIKPLKAAGDSMLVPLVGVNTFNKVRVSWFTSGDAGNATTATFPDAGLTPKLPSIDGTGVNEWKTTTPSVLRTQLMQTSNGFNLDQFDGSNANTLFLYPTAGAALPTTSFALDARRSGSAEPTMAKCDPSIVGGAYSCQMTITLPDPQGGTAANRANTFLFLTALYNKSLVRLELLNDNTVVSFKGVQPQIDSTGRANDVFRRVMTYVEMGNDGTYPDSALQIRGNLCKDFSVTKDATKYANSCTP